MPGGGGASRANREQRRGDADKDKGVTKARSGSSEGIVARRNRVHGSKMDEIMGHINRGKRK